MRFFIFILALLVTSCRFPNFKKNTGSGGGGGGRIPTVSEMQDWLDKSTDNPTRVCDSENTGNVETTSKYPKIYPYGSKAWTDDYSKIIYDGLNSKEYEPLLTTKISEADLDPTYGIGCPNFNHLSVEDKKKFWVIFFASMSKAESGFDTSLKYAEGGNLKGTISTGLFQISKSSASNHCARRINNGTPYETDDLINPETNIKCSMHIMMNQILGSPRINKKTGKIERGRPDLEGRLLTGKGVGVYYWAVLDKGRDGHTKMMKWLRPHLDTQLKSCNSNPLVADDNYEKPKCDNRVDNTNRGIKGVCVISPCPVENINENGTPQGQGDVISM